MLVLLAERADTRNYTGERLRLVFAVQARVKGGWAVAGLVTSIFATLLSLAAGVLGLLG